MKSAFLSKTRKLLNGSVYYQTKLQLILLTWIDWNTGHHKLLGPPGSLKQQGSCSLCQVYSLALLFMYVFDTLCFCLDSIPHFPFICILNGVNIVTFCTYLKLIFHFDKAKDKKIVSVSNICLNYVNKLKLN